MSAKNPVKVYVAMVTGGYPDSDWTVVEGVYRYEGSANLAGSRMAARANEFLRGVPKRANNSLTTPDYHRSVVAFKDGYEDLRVLEELYEETEFWPEDVLNAEVSSYTVETYLMERL